MVHVLLQRVHNQSSGGHGRVRVSVLLYVDHCQRQATAVTSHQGGVQMQGCLLFEQEETVAGPPASAPASRTASRTVNDSTGVFKQAKTAGAGQLMPCCFQVRMPHVPRAEHSSMWQALPARLDYNSATCTLLLLMRKDPAPECRQPTRGFETPTPARFSLWHEPQLLLLPHHAAAAVVASCCCCLAPGCSPWQA